MIMAGGRPTDYTPELLKKAKAYFDTARNQKDFFPSVADLSLELDISRETIYAWCKDPDKGEFSDTVSRLAALQEVRLMENGLMKRFDSSVTKLLLASNHGHREKQDITSDGKAMPAVLVRFLDEGKDNRHTE